MKLATLLLALFCASANAADRIRPTIEVTSLTMEVVWIETHAKMRQELVRAGRQPAGELDLAVTRGFSQLFRNTETGEYTCRIFAFKPDRLDGERGETLKHEFAHCLFGDWHR